MKKPIDVVYGVAESPPLAVTVLAALQHIGLVASSLVVPLIIGREAGASPEAVLDIVGLSLLALGIGAVLQALPRGPVGSGFLAPPDFTAAYLPSSLLALKTGGLSLVFGMTVFAGVVEAALSRVLRPLRPFFPPEISGLVVTALALSTGTLGIRYVLAIGMNAPRGPAEIAVSLATLGTAVALNVWTTGLARAFCILAGMAAGTGLAVALGVVSRADLAGVVHAPLAAVPHVSHLGWSFDVNLALPFAVVAVAGCLKAIGNITTCQKINDAEWTRPDMRSLGGGVLADGLGTMCAGLLGTSGITSASGNVGLASATGVTSRVLAYAMGALLLGLAFMPKASALIAILPAPVMGATLIFAACFILMSGMRIITSRMLDARKTIVIGMGLVLGVAVDVYAEFFAALTGGWRPMLGSSLVLATMTALVLNLIFRLGIRRRQTLVIDPTALDRDALHDFMEHAGAAWGARRDVIDRAAFNLVQSIETIVDACEPRGSLEVEATFDEFALDLRVSYDGTPLELPDKRPSADEVIASEAGQRKLAGFMLRRYADGVESTSRNGRAIVIFHFDH